MRLPGIKSNGSVELHNAVAVGMFDFIRTRRDIAAENLTTAASVVGYMVVAGASVMLAGAFIAYVFLRLI